MQFSFFLYLFVLSSFFMGSFYAMNITEAEVSSVGELPTEDQIASVFFSLAPEGGHVYKGLLNEGGYIECLRTYNDELTCVLSALRNEEGINYDRAIVLQGAPARLCYDTLMRVFEKQMSRWRSK